MQYDAHVVTTLLESQYQPEGNRGTKQEIPNLHLRTYNQLTEFLILEEGFEPFEAQETLVDAYFGIVVPVGPRREVFYDYNRGYQLHEYEEEA